MSSAASIVLCAVALFRSAVAQFDQTECFLQKKCLYVPENCTQSNTCQQIFSYSVDSDGWLTMEMLDHSSMPNANFIAVGFSKDNQMGEEAVTHCGFGESGSAEVHLSYNNGKSNTPLLETPEVEKKHPSPQLLQAHNENGVLYCKFRQARGAPNDDPYSLHDNFTLFIVHGVTDDIKRVSVHSLDHNSKDFPIILEDEVKLGIERNEEPHRKKSNVPSALRKLLVRAHGVIMVIAWFLLIASAVTAARYLRNLLPTKAVLGLRIWFLVHRTLNTLAVAFTIIATLIIFYAKGWRWTGAAVGRTQSENISAGAIHSTIGATAVGLSILQPFIALLRCAPESSSRPIFTIIHRTIGLSACLLAVISVLVAATSFHLWLDSGWAIALVIVYIVVVIIFAAGAEVIETINARRSSTISFEMSGEGRLRAEQVTHSSHSSKRNSSVTRLEAALFVAFVAFAIAIVVALVFLIVSS